jgi:hypothetical protein
MLLVIRRVGIAIGSLAAAWLVMALIGPWLFPFVGVSYRPDDLAASPGTAFVGIVTIVLGGLIYRDIMRREQPGR